MPDIHEDLTTEEQLRRCRELLAANLCAQGVRAMPDESLPQLIAKVSKIDRQQRHIDTLWNYVTTLKNFAVANRCDYMLVRNTGSIDRDSSLSTAGAPNLTSANSYFKIPTSFTIGGQTTTVSAANVVLIDGYFGVDWGTSSTAYYHYYSYSILNAALSDSRTFADLKAKLAAASVFSFAIRGSSMAATTSYGSTLTGYVTRYNDTHYRLLSYPYNTTYDYLGASALYVPVWAVKLPDTVFPAAPVIPKQEFYY